MACFAVRNIDAREFLGRATCSADAKQSAPKSSPEHDDIVGAPTRAPRLSFKRLRAGLADISRCAAGQQDLPDAVASKKCNPSTVRGEERHFAAFRAGYWLSLGLVDATHVQLRLSGPRRRRI